MVLLHTFRKYWPICCTKILWEWLLHPDFHLCPRNCKCPAWLSAKSDIGSIRWPLASDFYRVGLLFITTAFISRLLTRSWRSLRRIRRICPGSLCLTVDTTPNRPYLMPIGIWCLRREPRDQDLGIIRTDITLRIMWSRLCLPSMDALLPPSRPW